MASATSPHAQSTSDSFEVPRHVSIVPSDTVPQQHFAGQEIKGGHHRTESTAAAREEEAMTGRSDAPGMRSLWVIAKKGGDVLETPVISADNSGQSEGVAIFPSREKASLYIQVARWHGEYEARDVSPTVLSQWLSRAKNDGITSLVIDPNRHAQVHEHKPQQVLSLPDLGDLSGENILQEVFSRSK